MKFLDKDVFFHYRFGALVYEIAFVYFFVISFLQSSTYNDYFSPNVFHYVSLTALGLILFKIFFLDKQSIPIFIFNLLCIGLLILTWRTSQNFALLPLGFFIIGARNVNFREIIKLYFIVSLILLIFIMLSADIGLIKNLTYQREQSNTIRQSFGSVYPTDFASHVLFSVLAYIYLKFDKLTWKSYIVFIVIAFLLITFCDARLSSIALIISVPVVIVGQRAEKDKLISKFIASFYWIFPVITAYISLMGAIFFDENNQGFVKINNLVSGRLALSHEAFEKYGFSLFGKNVIEHGWGGTQGLTMFKSDPAKYFFIDSSYVRVTIFYGILVMLLLIAAMTIIALRPIHNGLFALASVMVIVSISAMVEQRLIDISFNPFLFALFAYTYKPKVKEKRS